MGTGKQSEEPDQMQGDTLRGTNIPRKGTPKNFMPRKPGHVTLITYI